MKRIMIATLGAVFMTGLIVARTNYATGVAPVIATGELQYSIVSKAQVVPQDRSTRQSTRPLNVTQRGAVITSLDFEDAAFPPKGWTLLDNVNLKTGEYSRHAWSRQTCEKDVSTGGKASAWCSGGGLDGAKNSCGVNIGLGTEPWLQHPGLDIRAYPAGIQIDLTVYMDTPVGKSVLYICAADEGTTNFLCATLALPNEQLRARWLVLQAPIYLPDTAGLSTVQVAFVFDDKDGSGDYPGIFIDNIKIEGLKEVPSTPEASATATRRVTATRTPSRTATRLRSSATPTRTSTPTRGRWRTYLPKMGRSPTETSTPTATSTSTPPPPTLVPTQAPWPVTGDLVIEQANILTDTSGGKKIVGQFRNNVARWTDRLDVNIDIDLFGPGGRAIGTATGHVSLEASGWGSVSCFDAYLDESEQMVETFRIKTSVDNLFGDVGPREHLEPFDVSIAPTSDTFYKVVGQVRNPHSSSVKGTDYMAVNVFDNRGTLVECDDVVTGVLQPGQSQVFEANFLRAMVGHQALRVEVQGFVQPLGLSTANRRLDQR